MHDERALLEERLNRTLKERIRPALYGESVGVDLAVWNVPDEPVPVAEALAAQYVPAKVGDAWGPPWGTSWFRLSGRVPQEWEGRQVELVVDLGFTHPGPGFQAEGLAYNAFGEPIKGIEPRNTYLPVSGHEVLFYLEAAGNPTILDFHPFQPTQLGDKSTAGTDPLYRILRADLAVFHPEVWHLILDIEVLQGLMKELPDHEPRRHKILRAVDRALDRLDFQDIAGTVERARAELTGVLAQRANASAHRVSAIGHAHIDSAWLWPLRETVRKCARTFSNVTRLMDEYPDFVFACSQAQQYAWMKDHHPLVYQRIADKVANGQFVPVGGMWVESDTNMPGGEAMVRQLVHGKRFFLDEFGVETEEVWLPDSFGYSAALPQLIKLSGSRWFLTQKLSWNQINKFPHHTFWWEGIDGTRVFTHFPPVDTYNSSLSGEELARASRQFAEHADATRSLVPFGYGDGGGGPTREMMETSRRVADLEGSPTVTVEAPAKFFQAAQDEYPNAPVWAGELYLEKHRATYTTQARTKQGNRRSEHLLREAELWATAATVLHGAEYPYAELDRLWKTVLLHQFHDILPGSSIAWVHREAEATYASVAQDLESIIGSAVATLAGVGERDVVFDAVSLSAGFDLPAAGVLDNGLLRITVDDNGLLTSIYDVANDREVIPPGAVGNLPQLHQDTPNQWDAWDIDPFYRNSRVDLTDGEVTIESDAIVVRRKFGESTMTQRLSLPAGVRQVDIETEVEWHEVEKLLKLAFPLDVRAEQSTSETQFGHLHRPIHTNTSWEAAKFEICAHRWLHVGEPGFGVALVNDSTYGHDVTRTTREDGGTTTTVRASLLRAPRFPDPLTDQGTHRFRHALVVGAGIPEAVAAGYRINLPPRVVRGSQAVEPLVSVNNPAVVVEAVKLADDRSGDVVVRLYEAHGSRARASLRTSFPVGRVQEVDLLERPLAESPVDLTLRPFQVLTLRFTREVS